MTSNINRIFLLCPLLAFYYRNACGIEFEDQVIVTGGWNIFNTVSIYNDDGWVKNLASLNTGRYNHACSHFTSDNDLVTRQLQLVIKICMFNPVVFNFDHLKIDYLKPVLCKQVLNDLIISQGLIFWIRYFKFIV